MKVIEVTEKNNIKKWMALPSHFYKNEPHYIPHIKQDVEKIFDPDKNKTFRHGEVTRWLLLDDNGYAIGRIAGFINKKYQNPAKFPVGGIGFFECVNDQSAANMLFDTAKKWLEQREVEAMDGPVNFGEKNQYWGLLIENFVEPNTYGMNFNPPYYKDLFENYGFREYYQQWMYWRSAREHAEKIFIKKSAKLESDPKYECRTAHGMSMEKIATDFLEVYNNAWGGHQGFKRMNYALAYKNMKSMKQVMDRDLVMFAYYDNKPIGMFISIPELNRIFKHVNGNLNWWGKLKFLYHKWKKTSDRMNGIIFGVVKEWQGKGVEGGLIAFADKTLIPKNIYKDLVMSWIGDFNPRMHYMLEGLGATIYRRYAVFRYIFDQSRPFERHPDIGRKKKRDQKIQEDKGED
jgi:GNAT superfamily N-acetyltransferase